MRTPGSQEQRIYKAKTLLYHKRILVSVAVISVLQSQNLKNNVKVNTNWEIEKAYMTNSRMQELHCIIQIYIRTRSQRIWNLTSVI